MLFTSVRFYAILFPVYFQDTLRCLVSFLLLWKFMLFKLVVYFSEILNMSFPVNCHENFCCPDSCYFQWDFMLSNLSLLHWDFQQCSLLFTSVRFFMLFNFLFTSIRLCFSFSYSLQWDFNIQINISLLRGDFLQLVHCLHVLQWEFMIFNFLFTSMRLSAV